MRVVGRSPQGGLISGVFAAAVLAMTVPPAARAAEPLYKDPKAPVEARVQDLLSRMTQAEKIAQLRCIWESKTDVFDDKLQFDLAKAEKALPDGIGQVARPSDAKGPISPRVLPGRDTRQTVALIDAMQHWAVDKTRLGIPILFHEEGLHGYAAKGPTSFPQAIAMASTWDPELITRVDSVIGRELAAVGVRLVLSPVVDVAREPRWGRIEETFGEDPYLVGEMGVAAIRGLQGDSLPLAEGKVFATLKHMTGHGQPESGTNVGPAEISERTLRESFLPPFEQAVARTRVQAVMASYNEVDGVPSHENAWLLGHVLRGEWGYTGAVVSDYDGIEQLKDLHHVAADYEVAAARALKAGVDMDLPEGEAFKALPQALEDGLVTQAEIDQAVRRVLRLKILAGLFEHPYADADKAVALTGNAEARALAAETARKAVVLLKNDGMLPLKTDGLKRLAVIGPNAAVARLGGYSGEPQHKISVLDGLRAKLAGRVDVTFAQGVKITKDDDWWADKVELADPAENEQLIQQAVEVARQADAVVLVLGDTEQTSREAWAANHMGDRDSLNLVGQQDELASAIFALGKPVTVVLLNGRPLSVVNIAEHADAVVEGWYLGQEGGTAMADILLGDANPGGKLPVTIPRSVGQLPMFYDYKPSAHRGYLFDTTKPLFPFGWGLSYTTFEVGTPKLSAPVIRPDGTVKVSVDVKNTGARAGDEVVQLYIHDEVSSVTRPIKELKGFKRITLQPGETRTVTFELGPEAFRFWNLEMKRVVEPGEFEIMAGDNSVDLKTATLTIRN